MRFLFSIAAFMVTLSLLFPQKRAIEYDCIIRHGMIYDGTGAEPYRGDVAIQHDTIALIGDLKSHKAKKEIDATGLAVAPGFINMLSRADENLVSNGYSISDIKQGLT